MTPIKQGAMLGLILYLLIGQVSMLVWMVRREFQPKRARSCATWGDVWRTVIDEGSSDIASMLAAFFCWPVFLLRRCRSEP